MKYSAIHNELIISQSEIKQAAGYLKHAIKCARKLAGVGLGKRKVEGMFTPLDNCENAILNIGVKIGIDFGVELGADLDLTENE